MIRYIKLYGIYVKKAIKSRLEYKNDAILGMISFLITNTVSFLTLTFVISSIPSLGTWSMSELGFLYGFAMMPRAIDHLFSDSLWYVGYWYVRNGLMDHYLTRPVNVLFQVVAEVFQPEAFGELFLGIVLLVVCGFNISFMWSIGSVVMLIVAIVFGSFIITSLKILTCSVAFWTKTSGVLMNMVYNFADFAKYPITIYHPIIRTIMTFIIPFGLIISIPIDTLINGTYNPWLISLSIIGIAIGLFLVAFFVWCRGLKHYDSSGS